MRESYSFINRLREDAVRGFSSLSRSASLFVDRAFQETDLLQLRYRLRSLDRQLKEAYLEVGEKAYGRVQRGDDTILSDEEAADLFKKIEGIRQDREKLAAEIEELKKERSDRKEPVTEGAGPEGSRGGKKAVPPRSK